MTRHPASLVLALTVCLTGAKAWAASAEGLEDTLPIAVQAPAAERQPAVVEASPVQAGESVAEPVEAPEPAELWVNGNAAYEAGEFARAVAYYRQLDDLGVENGHLHYNLGNAYLRSGELGRAIASYRRALRLLPRDEDAQANLDFARQSARDEIAPAEPSALLRTLLFWHYGLAPDETLRAAVFIGIGFWIVLAVRLYRPSSEVLRWVTVCLLVLGLALGGSLVAHAAFGAVVAVVVPPQIDIHAAAGEGSVVRFRLHAGTEIRVIEQRPEWIRIELPDGQRGWSKREYLDLVD